MLVLTILTAFLRFGIVPSNIITEKSYQLGFIFFILFSSLALVGRINLLKAETEKTNHDLYESEQKLLESEERYRSIVENTQEGLLIIVDDYKLEYINDKMSNILGQSYDEIIGRDFRDFLDHESRELAEDYFTRRLNGEDIPSKFELNIVRKNSEIKRIEGSFSFKDTGVGIDKDNLKKIFDPFFTTKDKDQGTGLGLSMVYNIIKQHNGFIETYSDIGVGSIFNIYLPILKNNIVQDSKMEDMDIPKGEGYILVVDDDTSMRTLAKDVLEDCGYSVITANNGKEGVKIFQKRYKDLKLVLLDMSMPEMSGKEAYIEMLVIDPNAKVLLCSGFRNDQRVDDIIKLGVDDFIQKPFTQEKLAKVVFKIITG